MESLAVERLRFLRLIEKHAAAKEATKFSKVSTTTYIKSINLLRRRTFNFL